MTHSPFVPCRTVPCNARARVPREGRIMAQMPPGRKGALGASGSARAALSGRRASPTTFPKRDSPD